MGQTKVKEITAAQIIDEQKPQDIFEDVKLQIKEQQDEGKYVVAFKSSKSETGSFYYKREEFKDPEQLVRKFMLSFLDSIKTIYKLDSDVKLESKISNGNIFCSFNVNMKRGPMLSFLATAYELSIGTKENKLDGLIIDLHMTSGNHSLDHIIDSRNKSRLIKIGSYPIFINIVYMKIILTVHAYFYKMLSGTINKNEYYLFLKDAGRLITMYRCKERSDWFFNTFYSPEQVRYDTNENWKIICNVFNEEYKDIEVVEEELSPVIEVKVEEIPKTRKVYEYDYLSFRKNPKEITYEDFDRRKANAVAAVKPVIIPAKKEKPVVEIKPVVDAKTIKENETLKAKIHSLEITIQTLSAKNESLAFRLKSAEENNNKLVEVNKFQASIIKKGKAPSLSESEKAAIEKKIEVLDNALNVQEYNFNKLNNELRNTNAKLKNENEQLKRINKNLSEEASKNKVEIEKIVEIIPEDYEMIKQRNRELYEEITKMKKASEESKNVTVIPNTGIDLVLVRTRIPVTGNCFEFSEGQFKINPDKIMIPSNIVELISNKIKNFDKKVLIEEEIDGLTEKVDEAITNMNATSYPSWLPFVGGIYAPKLMDTIFEFMQFKEK